MKNFEVWHFYSAPEQNQDLSNFLCNKKQETHASIANSLVVRSLTWDTGEPGQYPNHWAVTF